MSLKQLYPLYLSLAAMKKLRGTAQGQMGQFHHEKVMSTASIFLSGPLRGSSEADRGQFPQE